MPISFADLLPIIHPHRKERMFTVLFRAYLDESEESPIFAVGGFVGKGETWNNFEPQWLNALPAYVEYFHATDCFGGREQWKGILIPERVALLDKLTDLILANHIFMLGHAIDAKSYKQFAPAPKVNEFLGNKYVACFGGAIELACHSMDNSPVPRDIGEQCAFLIERNEYSPTAAQTFVAIKNDPILWYRNRIGTDTYGDKTGDAKIPLLQVADLGAFMTAKYFSDAPDGPIPWRPYYEKLKTGRRVFHIVHTPESNLKIFKGLHETLKREAETGASYWDEV